MELVPVSSALMVLLVSAVAPLTTPLTVASKVPVGITENRGIKHVVAPGCCGGYRLARINVDDYRGQTAGAYNYAAGEACHQVGAAGESRVGGNASFLRSPGAGRYDRAREGRVEHDFDLIIGLRRYLADVEKHCVILKIEQVNRQFARPGCRRRAEVTQLGSESATGSWTD